MSWFVYLLSCADGSLYTGIAKDATERAASHAKGTGAAYTRSRLPVELVYVEPAGSRAAALRRELAIKKLSRRRKLELAATRAQVACDAPLLTVPGFGAPHGFSTRAGGVSEGEYGTLNLGSNTADDPARIAANRRVFAEWFGAAVPSLLDQVHGDAVVEAEGRGPVEADAQTSADPEKLLVIATADCLPLLFYDRRSGAVGAAHCGWRGTLNRLAARTVAAMGERYGSRASDISVAVGPGICASCYEVSADLVERFRAAGFSVDVACRDGEGGWRLDLFRANLEVLGGAGIDASSVHFTGTSQGSPACTSCQPDLFFSHRRDRGVTGRHWAAIRAVVPTVKG